MSEGPWTVPVELAVAALPPGVRAGVYARIAAGEVPDPSAEVRLRNEAGRFWVLLTFCAGPDLLSPLDCWPFSWREG